MVPSISQGWWGTSQVLLPLIIFLLQRLVFRSFLVFQATMLFYLFFNHNLIDGVHFQYFKVFVGFFFLRVFRFFLEFVLLFFSIFIFFHFSLLSLHIFYAKFHSYILTVYSYFCIKFSNSFSFSVNSLMLSIYNRWLTFSCDLLNL